MPYRRMICADAAACYALRQHLISSTLAPAGINVPIICAVRRIQVVSRTQLVQTERGFGPPRVLETENIGVLWREVQAAIVRTMMVFPCTHVRSREYLETIISLFRTARDQYSAAIQYGDCESTDLMLQMAMQAAQLAWKMIESVHDETAVEAAVPVGDASEPV